ncbi:uncharacterized protein N7483_002779 [Penicillium malachiteum]|uniref:uncharacterized protein n=1 Tax=Penicillium malachiteum TaxID=1324776 RepID=UPI00254853F4|nr:uncharacterized protein N7483_002779 [Penicillium malachiteum]KAJ5737654.1 hypothetical protein N7483_002779 [Penicillium malachiteum]
MHHYSIEKNFQPFPPSNLTPLTPQILGENHDPEKNRTKATRSLKLQVRNAQEWVKAQKGMSRRGSTPGTDLPPPSSVVAGKAFPCCAMR